MDILFYILGAAALASAVISVTRRSPLSAALWLIISFLNMAGLFAMLTAPLIAAMQVLIAAGAVMVLMLFVVMLVDIRSEVTRPRLVRFGKILGAAGAAYLAIVITIAVAAPPFVEAPQVGDYYRSTATLGLHVLKGYAVAFEITGVLLLAACVAAVSLAKREGPEERAEEEELEAI